MIRKTLSMIIFLSMVLHCAFRIGFFSYIYDQRNEIAYALGIISEVPIAVCSSDYDFSEGISVSDDEQQHSLPLALTVQEIILFCETSEGSLISKLGYWPVQNSSPYHHRRYRAPRTDIFQPPRS